MVIKYVNLKNRSNGSMVKHFFSQLGQIQAKGVTSSTKCKYLMMTYASIEERPHIFTANVREKKKKSCLWFPKTTYPRF